MFRCCQSPGRVSYPLHRLTQAAGFFSPAGWVGRWPAGVRFLLAIEGRFSVIPRRMALKTELGGIRMYLKWVTPGQGYATGHCYGGGTDHRCFGGRDAWRRAGQKSAFLGTNFRRVEFPARMARIAISRCGPLGHDVPRAPDVRRWENRAPHPRLHTQNETQ